MKQKILALAICTLSASPMKAQIPNLISHLNGWGNNILNCPGVGGGCPTYDYLCRHSSGCSPILPSNQMWNKIGTPANPFPNSGLVTLISGGGVTEGLFTQFNFQQNATYYVHVGLTRSAITYGSTHHMGNSNIELFAAKNLVESAPGAICCQEASLWDFNSSAFNVGYWHNNVGQADPNVNGIRIGTFHPSWYSNPTSKAFSTAFTVPSGTTFNQFAIHPYLSADAQYEADLDYIVIERECEAAFTYTINTADPMRILFESRWAPNTTYTWDLGDLNTATGTTVDYTYGSGGTGVPWPNVNVCLQTSLEDGTVTCNSCRNFCFPEITRERYGVMCEYYFDFKVKVGTKYSNKVDVIPNINPISPYDIDFGDGTILYNRSGTTSHQYAQPGNYTICVTDINRYCTQTVCASICLNDQFNVTGYNEGDEVYQTTSGQKQAPTEQYNVNSDKFIARLDDPSFLKKDVLITPNPVNSAATIAFTATENSTAELIVYNLVGQKLLNQTNSTHKGSNVVTLDMNSLASGMYIIQLKVGDQTTVSKISKQ